MKTELRIDLTFDQILHLVKQLNNQDKIKLSKALEKDAITSKLTRLLNTFHSDVLSLDAINEEVEIVRKQHHENKKH